MIAPDRDPVGIDSLDTLAAQGFDYIELSLAHMALASEEEFKRVRERVDGSALRCEACNNFFPPHVRLTGPDADLDAALEYGSLAMARAAQLGVEVIVLGSSGAKNVPEGFAIPEARRQFSHLLRGLAPMAEAHGITIAIEPISRPEANFVNLTGEGLAFVREVDHSRIRLLVDYYHMATEGESTIVIREAGDAIRHAHFARPGDRLFPMEWEDRFGPFFQALGQVGYSERLSIEAFTGNLEVEGARALEIVRNAVSAYVPEETQRG